VNKKMKYIPQKFIRICPECKREEKDWSMQCEAFWLEKATREELIKKV
jgi:hypothetical protein